MHEQNKQHHDQIKISIIAEPKAELPTYASSGASGADVRAFIQDDILIKAGSSELIPTGLRFSIPHGYEIQIRPRSGLALKHQITVLNTPGTIDADYTGEVGIILINCGKADFIVTPGMRIAQLVIAPVVQACFLEVKELSLTLRGAKGFGHSGIH